MLVSFFRNLFYRFFHEIVYHCKFLFDLGCRFLQVTLIRCLWFVSFMYWNVSISTWTCVFSFIRSIFFNEALFYQKFVYDWMWLFSLFFFHNFFAMELLWFSTVITFIVRNNFLLCAFEFVSHRSLGLKFPFAKHRM
jgi:hypothetical protein